jgi:hypothetical protein
VRGALAAAILSAFFGLDDGLPLAGTTICPPAVVLDGLPVVFRDEIDERTLWPWDFAVTRRSGRTTIPACATTAPANEESEDRTVLLIGQFGDARSDPPVRVTVRANLRDEAGRDLRGATAPVTALQAGPRLVYAEPAPPESDALTYPLLTPSVLRVLQTHTQCPAATVARVRVTWDGGVSSPAGGEVGTAQRRAYSVRLVDGRVIRPAALADLGDMDNNHLLCLDTATAPRRVRATAGAFADPRGDVNAATVVRITR